MKINNRIIAGLLCAFFLTACENNAKSENYTSETGSSAFENVSESAVSEKETQGSDMSESLPPTESVSANVVSYIVSDEETESLTTTESIPEDTVTPINNMLFGDILPQTDTLRFFVQDNFSDSVLIYFAETKQASVVQEVFDSISAVPIEKADDWSAKMMTLPVYGFYAYDNSNSIMFSAAWSNGFWIAEDGTAYRLDYDFSTVAEGYEWDGYGYYGNGYVSDMPCGYYFCFDENGWIKDNIQKRLPFAPAKAPEDITVEHIGFDDGGGIRLLITNNREDDYLLFEHFQAEVLLDDEWYVIPPLKGNWTFTRFNIPASSSFEFVYPLEKYGDLPEGSYRIVGTDFYVEFAI